MYALINEGLVEELFAELPVVPSEVLKLIVSVSEGVEVGWIVDADGDTIPPDKPESYETWDKTLGAYVEDAAVRDAARREEIRAELMALDALAIRPLRAMAAGTATAEDTAKLAEIEAQAAALRVELAGLA